MVVDDGGEHGDDQCVVAVGIWYCSGVVAETNSVVKYAAFHLCMES